jgi:hypothetical protein
MTFAVIASAVIAITAAILTTGTFVSAIFHAFTLSKPAFGKSC